MCRCHVGSKNIQAKKKIPEDLMDKMQKAGSDYEIYDRHGEMATCQDPKTFLMEIGDKAREKGWGK